MKMTGRLAGGAARVSLTRRAAYVLLAAVVFTGSFMLASPRCARSEGISRQVRDSALRDVQSMIRYGNYDSARERLEWLYAGLPQDEAVVVSFYDFLVGRQEYARAREVMETYLESRPTYVGGMAKLADLYLKMGEAGQARSLLEKFIAAGHKRAWAYEVASQTYINSGRMEDALEIIRAGREHHKDDRMLYEQAAQVYLRTRRYADAVDEYLLAVEAGLIQADAATRKIIAVAEEPGAVEVLTPVLEDAVERGIAGLVPLTALWHLHMADGDCVRGLDEVTRIVESDNGLIELLVNAAREFKRSECYGECAEAYGLAAELTDARDAIPEFLLARGRCQELSGDMDAAIETYEDFAGRYSDSRRAFDAYMALAGVLRGLGRYDDALVHADMAMNVRAAGDAVRGAVLMKGDCLVILERFDEAKQVYDLVRPDWESSLAQTAYYNLGEIAFYEHDFEAALSYFNVAMKEYPGEILANDAVERLILIRGSKTVGGPPAELETRDGEAPLSPNTAYAPELEAFATAALLERQGEYEEAVSLLRVTAAAGPEEVRTQSLKGLVRIYLGMGDYEQALEICAIAGETIESHWSPVALETAGDVYLHLDMRDEAVAAYEDVIVRYPESVSAGESRRKLDLVRKAATD